MIAVVFLGHFEIIGFKQMCNFDSFSDMIPLEVFIFDHLVEIFYPNFSLVLHIQVSMESGDNPHPVTINNIASLGQSGISANGYWG
jgi:hypothetical protein